MSNLLYFIALILLIGWLLGFFVYSAGYLIHILLVIAVIPVFTEMGGNLKLAGKVLKGEEAEKLVKAQAERSRLGTRKTYLYGLAGITTFVLALVFI